jgi:hypothetical protein
MAGIYLIAHTNSCGRRRQILAEGAYVVRQRAISRGDDFEGWHLARLMRDAATPFEVATAETPISEVAPSIATARTCGRLVAESASPPALVAETLALIVP